MSKSEHLRNRKLKLEGYLNRNHKDFTLFKLYSAVSLYLVWVFRDLYIEKYPVGTDWLTFISDPALRHGPLGFLKIWKNIGFGEVSLFTLRNVISLANGLFPVKFAAVGIAHLSLTLGACALIKYLSRFVTSPLALLGSIIFVVNPYIATQIASGHLHQIAGYGLTPLLLLLIEDYLSSRRDIRAGILLSFVVAVYSILRIDPAAYAALLFLVYLGLRKRDLYKPNPVDELARRLRLASAVTVFTVLLTSFQWIPLITGGVPDYASLAFNSQVLEKYSLSFRKSLLGLGREYAYLFWRYELTSTSHPLQFLKPVYPELMVLLPAVVLTGFAASTREKKDMFAVFGLSALIAGFIAKGPHPPAPEVFTFLREHVPFFSSMRVANRWISVVWVSFSVLIPLSILTLSENRLEEYASKTVAAAVSLGVILVIVTSTFPVSLEGYDGWTPSQNKQNAYQSLKGEPGKIAVVPYDSTRIKTETRGVEKLLAAKSSMFHRRPISNSEIRNSLAKSFDTWSEEVMKNNESRHLGSLLGDLGVTNIVISENKVTHVDHYGVNDDWEVTKPFYQHKFWRSQRHLSLKKNYSGTEIYEVENSSSGQYVRHHAVALSGNRDLMLKLERNSNADFVPLYVTQAENRTEYMRILEATDIAVAEKGGIVPFAAGYESFENDVYLERGPNVESVEHGGFGFYSDRSLRVSPGEKLEIQNISNPNLLIRMKSESRSSVRVGDTEKPVQSVSWYNYSASEGSVELENLGRNDVLVDTVIQIDEGDLADFRRKATSIGLRLGGPGYFDDLGSIDNGGSDEVWKVFPKTYDKKWSYSREAEHYRAYSLVNVFYTSEPEGNPKFLLQKYRELGFLISVSALVIMLLVVAKFELLVSRFHRIFSVRADFE